MIKSVFTYCVGVAILGLIMTGLVSLTLQFVPHILLGCALIFPISGIIKLVWKKDLKLGRVLKGIKMLFRIGKQSLGAYLVTGFVIALLYDEMALALAEGLLWSTIGLVGFAIVWEGARIAIRNIKKVEIPSYFDAIKNGI